MLSEEIERYFQMGRGNSAADDLLERALAEIKAKQAEIDALMLEYCPDEMSKEQMAEWEKHQVKEKSPESRPDEDKEATKRKEKGL